MPKRTRANRRGNTTTSPDLESTSPTPEDTSTPPISNSKVAANPHHSENQERSQGRFQSRKSSRISPRLRSFENLGTLSKQYSTRAQKRRRESSHAAASTNAALPLLTQADHTTHVHQLTQAWRSAADKCTLEVTSYDVAADAIDLPFILGKGLKGIDVANLGRPFHIKRTTYLQTLRYHPARTEEIVWKGYLEQVGESGLEARKNIESFANIVRAATSAPETGPALRAREELLAPSSLSSELTAHPYVQDVIHRIVSHHLPPDAGRRSTRGSTARPAKEALMRFVEVLIYTWIVALRFVPRQRCFDQLKNAASPSCFGSPVELRHTPEFETDKSQFQLGLFATHPIAAGTTLPVFGFLGLPFTRQQYRERQELNLDWSTMYPMIPAYDAVLHTRPRRSADTENMEDGSVADKFVKGNPTQLYGVLARINHESASRGSNCESVFVAYSHHFHEFVTLRDIVAGEQLTWDYGDEYHFQ